MAQNPEQEGFGSKFTNRQKGMAAAVVVVVLVIAWQIMGLFGGDNATKQPTMQMQPTAASKVTGGSQTQMTAGGPSGGTSMTPQTNPGMAVPQNNPQAQPIKAVVPNEQQVIISQQQDSQKQYVDTINQLQMLKLQKDIDETKQSIATARLATATAEKNITDLFTKPAPGANTQQQADYAKMLGGPTGTGGNIPPPPIQTTPQVAYVVISVSMRLGHWMAVLGNQGKLFSVSVGDIIPADGSEVVAIGKNGVVLKKDNVKRKINIVNSI